MVARHFKGRYLGSALGGFWASVNPLAQILIYTLVFSQVMPARLPGVHDALAYSLYVCAGLFTWNYFIEVLLRTQTVFLDQANLLFLAFLLVNGHWPGWVLVALLPLLLIQQVFALGFGLIPALVNVFFRDVAQVVAVGLQFWFWADPDRVSDRSIAGGGGHPARVEPAVPARGFVPADCRAPAVATLGDLWGVSLVAVLFALVSDALFRRLSGPMMDEL
jgi:lipopolysaccharide transport system permease protein